MSEALQSLSTSLILSSVCSRPSSFEFEKVFVPEEGNMCRKCLYTL